MKFSISIFFIIMIAFEALIIEIIAKIYLHKKIYNSIQSKKVERNHSFNLVAVIINHNILK
ncbi:MAG: hypothetical protein DSZ11_05795 [Sulfurovum sp.]|nr:MAG: hypothetical protein DSZ11_05795 [Sulfurovum sp.]